MTPPEAPVEFWFDFGSPYSYFAALRVEAMAARHGRVVRWRPFLLGVVFKQTGGQPLTPDTPAGRYALHDWQRLARLLQRPFRLPPELPVRAVAPSRAFYWLEAHDPERAVPFARAVFQRCFGEGRDITRPQSSLHLAAHLGADRHALAAGMTGPAARQRLREATADALRLGVFGAPFFLVDGEPFWGHDRLPMVDQWLQTGGW